MSLSSWQKWNNTSGPVTKDTTLSRSGAKWANTQGPVASVKKLTTSFVLPAFSIPFNGSLASPACRQRGQYNYSLSQAFSILNWRELNYVLTNLSRGFVSIRYRVGTVATRYLFAENQGGGTYIGDVPLYVGQIIQPNFVLEIWNIIIFGNRTVANNNPISFTTSILSDPSAATDNVGPVSQSVTGQITAAQLGNNLPWAMPIAFTDNGRWLTN